MKAFGHWWPAKSDLEDICEMNGGRNMHIKTFLMAFGVLLLVGCVATPTVSPISSPFESPLDYVATPQTLPGNVVMPPPSYGIGTVLDTPDPEYYPVAISGVWIGVDGHEVVTVTNISQIEQPIGLWSIQNQDTWGFFNFPADLVVPPDASVRVHSGIPEDQIVVSDTDLYWSSERQWVRQGLDSLDVLLLNQAGRIMYWFLFDD